MALQGGWNKKNSGFGRGAVKAFGNQKDHAIERDSSIRNWRAQNNSSARQGGISYVFTPVEAWSSRHMHTLKQSSRM
jgi:DNA-directed RNA polymerase-5 subunit 1